MKHHTLNILSFVLVSNIMLGRMDSINETHKECVYWGERKPVKHLQIMTKNEQLVLRRFQSTTFFN